ncbi:hypothetical protein [Bremerella cremea]|uniref:hypothetical protein n=1 Tax=Bremerella cremea TaxID=1031537 RepID=UPI0031EF12C9
MTASPALFQESIPADEPAKIAKLIELQQALHQRSGAPTKRAQHPKHHGLLHGEMIVSDAFDSDLKVGLFALPGRYPIVARCSNGLAFDDSQKDVHGLAIRIRGLENGQIQDLLAIDQSEFFIRNLDVYQALLEAKLNGGGRAGTLGRYLMASWNPLQWRFHDASLLLKIGQTLESFLATDYFSTTPYRLGPLAVKFRIKFVVPGGLIMQGGSQEDKLGVRLAAQLQRGPVVATLSFQKQQDPKTEPTEDPTVPWKTPWREVATLNFHQGQVPNAVENMQEAEELEFNPWHCLDEHQPLGAINRARKPIYEALVKQRKSSQPTS